LWVSDLMNSYPFHIWHPTESSLFCLNLTEDVFCLHVVHLSLPPVIRTVWINEKQACEGMKTANFMVLKQQS
jgi:hypothetical protein